MKLIRITILPFFLLGGSEALSNPYGTTSLFQNLQQPNHEGSLPKQQSSSSAQQQQQQQVKVPKVIYTSPMGTPTNRQKQTQVPFLIDESQTQQLGYRKPVTNGPGTEPPRPFNPQQSNLVERYYPRRQPNQQPIGPAYAASPFHNNRYAGYGFGETSYGTPDVTYGYDRYPYPWNESTQRIRHRYSPFYGGTSSGSFYESPSPYYGNYYGNYYYRSPYLHNHYHYNRPGYMVPNEQRWYQRFQRPRRDNYYHGTIPPKYVVHRNGKQVANSANYGQLHKQGYFSKPYLNGQTPYTMQRDHSGVDGIRYY
jgi:hypothetical protein